MNSQKENNELNALRRSTRDIVAISALPSIWIHQTPAQVSRNLAETLYRILDLEFAFVRFKDGDIPLESIYAHTGFLAGSTFQDLISALDTYVETQKVSPALSELTDGKDILFATIPVGPESVNGVVVVGCNRDTFPNEPERLVLNIATNQANVTIQHKLSVRNLEQERELRERFVNTLTHDLRTPLTAAKMSAQLLGRNGVSSEKQVSLAGRIVDSLNRANQMIENLLDANSINAGKTLTVKKSEQEMNSLINDTLVDLITMHGERFVLTSSEKVIQGFWSPEGIRRIIENLCANAVKYGDTRLPIEIHLLATPEDVRISVHNMGNPIPYEEQLKLFDPFQRLNSDKQVQGWGLGLTLVKGLVGAHGGQISVTSSRENGTTFTILLPRQA